MPKNTINDLRNHIFEAIEMLKDGDMDVETLKGLCHAAQTVANLTKLEIEFVKTVGSFGTGFIPIQEEELKRLRERNF